MLGESHALTDDFPEFKPLIAQLMAADARFAADTKRYNALDKEIRTLELRDGPIGDDAMHKLKHDRAVLKDALYARLQNGA